MFEESMSLQTEVSTGHFQLQKIPQRKQLHPLGLLDGLLCTNIRSSFDALLQGLVPVRGRVQEGAHDLQELLLVVQPMTFPSSESLNCSCEKKLV